tara:strand:- start:89 stop:730 length:642 start_codon:yes stop_codon:yes gene_type:complete
VDTAMNINPSYKYCRYKSGNDEECRIEKYILRKAFQVKEGEKEWLPNSVLWRQKEQFSDGVGYNWIDSLKDTVEKKITDYDLDNAGTKYKYNTPDTKEGYYYRQIFEELFPNRQKVVSPWLPQTQWDNVRKDPSGRAQNAHSKQNNNNNSSSNNNNNSNIEQNTKINVLKDPNLKSIKIKKIDNDLKKNNDEDLPNKNDDLSTHERCLGFLVV